MESVSLSQRIDRTLTILPVVVIALFGGLFVLKTGYFTNNHLLSVFAVIMTALGGGKLYLLRGEGKTSLRTIAIAITVLLLMLLAAVYIDFTANRLLHPVGK